MTTQILKKAYRISFCLWAATILWLSLDPSPPVPETGLLAWDKFQHASAYGLLTALGGGSLSSIVSRFKRRWLASGVFAVLYGGLMEVLQGLLTASRTAEFGDLLADGVGAVFVMAVAFAVERSGCIPSRELE